MERFKVEYLRLHSIDEEIRTQKYPSAIKLAERTGVSRRTILRDIIFMANSLNAPIAYDKKKRGYYYTIPHFTISDISLDGDETLALLFNGKLALQFLQGTNLFDRVRFGLESLERRSEIYSSGAEKELTSRIHLAIETPPISIKRDFEALLFDSLVKGRLLRVTLENEEECVVLPLMTVLYKHDWGLFCLQPEAFSADFQTVSFSEDHFGIISLWNVRAIRPYKTVHGKEIFLPSKITRDYENIRLACTRPSEQNGDDLLCISCPIEFLSLKGSPHTEVILTFRQEKADNGTCTYTQGSRDDYLLHGVVTNGGLL